ncbi:hypothetical protein [Streptomyces platensis]|uniref:hypothetical protein n=1 Tax=Streptomyces platensis TaxID=58346 RepID=UPI001F44517A|nr:hypothetical protein [Streptomyces platensis]MCF3143960.1 hypothetical protein [Streptomyces platensis]
MRTARTLFASAVITAMFAVTAPAATAVEGHTTDHVASSSSRHDHDRCGRGHHRHDHHWRDHHRRDHHNRDHHRRDHHRRDHHRPSGGVHTGGGALADLLR